VPSRRAFLGSVAGLGAASAGCLGAAEEEPVDVLVAGSLAYAVGRGLEEAVEVPVRVQAHGSAAAARMVAGGVSNPDIVALADPVLFESVLQPEWYVTFATNALTVVYNPETDGGRLVREAGPDRWWEPMQRGDVRLGRTDPDRDPLGYRTLFGLELTGRYYPEAPALRETLPEPEQIYPETQLLAQFETGSIDAAVAYRSMAVERGYDRFDLPPAIDLSDPAHASTYAETSYRLPDGTEVSGAPITYAATVRRTAPPQAVRTVFETITEGTLLAEHGFARPPAFPEGEGNVPSWTPV
jgi:molybdate/tungstate transport system substrate-binding protein